MLAVDIPFICDDRPGTISLVNQVFNHGSQIDLRATFARRLGQCMSGTIRIDVAFIGIKHTAEHITCIYDRAELLNFIGADQMTVNSEDLVPGMFVS